MVKKLLNFCIFSLFFSFLFSCADKPLESDMDIENGGEILFSVSTLSSTIIGDGEIGNTPEATDPLDVNNFRVKIENPKGLLLKEWERLDQLPGSIKFGVGKFVAKVIGGDSTAQGFDIPSFIGIKQFEVFYKEQTQIDVKCKHSKALVSVVPKAGFANYYSDYSVEVNSEYSPEKLKFDKDDKRIAYFVPSNLTVKLFVTRIDGTKLQSDPVKIEDVKAADHFILTLNNSNSSGDINLGIKLEGTTDREEIKVIPLKAVSGKAPYFIPTGFDLANSNIIIGEGQDRSVKLLIKAGATIDECEVTVKSGFLISQGLPSKFSFTTVDNNVELSNKLKTLGIKWSRSMKGATMAEIDFTGLVNKLPAAEKKELKHTFDIKVTDYINRSTETLPLCFAVQPPYFNIDEVNSVEKAVEGGAEVLNIKMKGYLENATIDNISRLEYSQDGAAYYGVDKTKVNYGTPSGGYFDITVSGLGGITAPIIKMRLVSKTNITDFERSSEDVYIKIETPKFLIDALPDNIGSSLTVNVNVSDTDKIPDFNDNKLALYANNQGRWEVVAASGTYSGGVKTFNLTDIPPCTRMRLRVKYDNKYNSDNDVTFENFGFSMDENWTSMSESNINHGGAYGYKAITNNTKQDKVSITVMTPQDSPWTTVNQKTANYLGSAFTADPKNSWFIVPSAKKIDGFSGNGVEIRSVAWSHGDLAVPNNVGTALWENRSKSDVTPPTFDEGRKAAGKLFLGTYDITFNGGSFNETYNYTKYKLYARPATFKGKYKFQQYDGDKALIKVIIYGMNNGVEEIIGEGKFIPDANVTNWADFEVPINYYNTLKASSYTIICSSSADENNIKLNLNDRSNCVAIGNILSVDEFKLVY